MSKAISRDTIYEELSGRTGLTPRQIAKVFSELRNLQKERGPGPMSLFSGKPRKKQPAKAPTATMKFSFTKKQVLALVDQEPTLEQLIAELKKTLGG